MTNALITLGLCLLLIPLLLWLVGRALASAKYRKPQGDKGKPKTGMPHGDDQERAGKPEGGAGPGSAFGLHYHCGQ